MVRLSTLREGFGAQGHRRRDHVDGRFSADTALHPSLSGWKGCLRRKAFVPLYPRGTRIVLTMDLKSSDCGVGLSCLDQKEAIQINMLHILSIVWIGQPDIHRRS